MKPRLYEEVCKRFPDRATPILDVGAGSGSIGKGLREHGYTNVCAIEIWPRYITEFELAKVYRKVARRNALDFDFWPFDLAIFGDVLEHWTHPMAASVLGRCFEAASQAAVIVPWKCPQGPWEGNPHEEHKQPDLTPAVMRARYPDLDLIAQDEAKGLLWGPGQPSGS